MATSGTYTFGVNTQIAQIITEAFERLGIFGEQVSGDMMTSAINSLNFMFNSWGSDESKQWTINTLVQYPITTPQLGIPTFQLAAGQYDILDMAYRYQGIDIGMAQISRDEYLLVSQKTVQSVPVNYFVDKSTTPPTVYLYPVPNSTLITLLYNAVSLPQDVTDPSFRIPNTPWWTESVAAGLTARLADKFKKELYQEKVAEAEAFYRKASRSDVDQTNARIRTPYKF